MALQCVYIILATPMFANRIPIRPHIIVRLKIVALTAVGNNSTMVPITQKKVIFKRDKVQAVRSTTNFMLTIGKAIIQTAETAVVTVIILFF
uniref:Putative secreted protein n=1 Tax=Panstrongylus lignarius TaxID=156445 RepID=A0A224XRN1_9HEMI